MSEAAIQFNEQQSDSSRKGGSTSEGRERRLKTLDDPLARQITFADLAQEPIQALVLTMMRSSLIGEGHPDDTRLLQMLNSGQLEAWFIMDTNGSPAGIVTMQFVVMDNVPTMHIVTAAIAPHISEAGWKKLFRYGEDIAAQHGCKRIQFYTMEQNKRIREIGRMWGGKETNKQGLTRVVVEH